MYDTSECTRWCPDVVGEVQPFADLSDDRN